MLAAAFVLTAAVLQAKDANTTGVMHMSSKTGKWSDGPLPGVQMMPIRGDMATGPYAVFTKFAPGADHGWHSHTNDVSILVLSGAYLFKDESGMEKRVGPGEYFTIPGGHKHWSGSDAKEGVLFFHEGTAKFDLVPAAATASDAK
jgi:mannose-6-phosphate isomerase-like protein (cupin superfamily)